MREIKFRAWDTRHNKLLAWHEIAMNDDPFFHEDCDFILEQYTGLKDKNGKKIYEGDILDGGADGYCIVYWDEYSLSYCYSCDHASALPLFAVGKVVGNIHENPELLK